MSVCISRSVDAQRSVLSPLAGRFNIMASQTSDQCLYCRELCVIEINIQAGISKILPQ